MSKSRTKQKAGKSLANEVLAVVLVAAAALLMLSLVTYDSKDPSWNADGPRQEVSNIIGVAGAYLGDFFLQLFGLAALVIPVLLVLIAARAFFSDRAEVPIPKAVGATLLLVALSGFLALFPRLGLAILDNTRSNGGAVGHIIENALASSMNTIGAAIILTMASILTLMLTMEVSLAPVSHWLHLTREARAESRKGKPGMLERLSAWWSERSERHRQQAELRHHERKLLEEEKRQREREDRVRLDKDRRNQSDERKRTEATVAGELAVPVVSARESKAVRIEP